MKILAYDLGGTKLAAAVVNSRGVILEQIRVPALFAQGKAAVLSQMVDLGQEMMVRHAKTDHPINRIGIASAGPLDPRKGLLLNPTNFGKRDWGRVPLVKILRSQLKLSTVLENDAAAAVLAERWVGGAKKFENVMVLTLGTGLGTGIICNGRLVRAGQHLHTEAGHMIIRPEDLTVPCGCGNYGCAEILLSGRGFAHRTSFKLGKHLKAPEIAELARGRAQFAVQAMQEYGVNLAIAINNYCQIFNPEVFILTGSFAEAWDLFSPFFKKEFARLRRDRPRVKVSTLHNSAGLIGAAYSALEIAK